MRRCIVCIVQLLIFKIVFLGYQAVATLLKTCRRDIKYIQLTKVEVSRRKSGDEIQGEATPMQLEGRRKRAMD